jgi:hypothetical protein
MDFTRQNFPLKCPDSRWRVKVQTEKGSDPRIGSYPHYSGLLGTIEDLLNIPNGKFGETGSTDRVQVWTLNCPGDILSGPGESAPRLVSWESIRGESRGHNIEQSTIGKPHEPTGNRERL